MRCLEICADSLAAARTAQHGGADRLELCGDLAIGGVTPDPGLLSRVLTELTLPVQVMIRPRGGGFLYTEDELETMRTAIRVIRTQWPGIRGFVTGALKPDGTLDRVAMDSLMAAAGPYPVTLHRAFDRTADLAATLEVCVSLGIERILTSGGKPTVDAGLSALAALERQAAGRIGILPGGGVTADNAERILRETGVRELHLSARKRVVLGPAEDDACYEADAGTVRTLREILDR